MKAIGIVGSGPKKNIPNLTPYNDKIDYWIGADKGSFVILNNDLPLHESVGDFDSIQKEEWEILKEQSKKIHTYPEEKDQTDLELAIERAISLKPKEVFLFGVTGGRLDHELINIQLLLTLAKQNIKGYIIDEQNIVKLVFPNTYKIEHNIHYPYISFIPFSEKVTGLTLKGFYYPLKDETIYWGSTLCISNKLVLKSGTFLFNEGILLVIKSRDK